ncbi:hypothetical protein TNCV_2911301 [Trichonephila clavipes]|nr:hypothetical protein TNCV_2911301 [Trichonephila clavipes]
MGSGSATTHKDQIAEVLRDSSFRLTVSKLLSFDASGHSTSKGVTGLKSRATVDPSCQGANALQICQGSKLVWKFRVSIGRRVLHDSQWIHGLEVSAVVYTI